MKFKLNNEPLAYQITVHKNNYEYYFGQGTFEEHYRLVLRSVRMGVKSIYPVMDNIVVHYGEGYIDNWINEIMAA